MSKWNQPQVVSDVQKVFPGPVTGTLLPSVKEIPQEFFDQQNKWASFVSTLFHSGWDGRDPSLAMKDDVDAHKAFEQVTTVLKSFEPKHENKIAGAAYLLSLWFKDVIPADQIQTEGETA